MNYACISNKPFVTTKDLSAQKNLSQEARSRRAYIRSHKFSLCVNPSTQQAEVEIIDKRCNN